MPTNAVLVETTILIDYLRGSEAAASYLDAARAGGLIICSAVTRAELIVGARDRSELKTVDQLLNRFRLEPKTAVDSTRSLLWLRNYFHANGVGYHDCLLAAGAVRLRIR